MLLNEVIASPELGLQAELVASTFARPPWCRSKDARFRLLLGTNQSARDEPMGSKPLDEEMASRVEISASPRSGLRDKLVASTFAHQRECRSIRVHLGRLLEPIELAETQAR